MRSNYKKNITKVEELQGTNDDIKIKGFSEKPSISEIVRFIRPLVVNDYKSAIEKYGEDEALVILAKMLSVRYMKKFEPQTPEVKIAVKKCVIEFITKMSLSENGKESKIGSVLRIQTIQRKTEEQLKDELEKLQTIKKSMALKIKTGIDELIEVYKQEIKRRFVEEQSAEILGETIEAEEDILPATLLPEISEVTQDIQSKEATQIAEVGQVYNQTCRRRPICKSVEVKKKSDIYSKYTLEGKAEEVKYYELVRDFTSGFEFLAEDEISYYSKVGGSNPIQFDSFDRYSRFQDLRYRVNKRMSAMKISELEAIFIELDDKCSLLGPADKKILADRRDAINREMSRNTREER